MVQVNPFSTPFQPRLNATRLCFFCASFAASLPLQAVQGLYFALFPEGVYLYHYAANTPLNAHQRLLVEPYAPAGVYRWSFGPRSCRRDSYPGPAPVHPLPPYCRRTWSYLLILCKPWRHVYLYLYPALMGTHRLFRGPKSHVLKIEPPHALQEAASGVLYQTGVNTHPQGEKPTAALCKPHARLLTPP